MIAKLADSVLKSASIDLEHKRLVRELLQESTEPHDKALAKMGLNIILVDGSKAKDMTDNTPEDPTATVKV